MEYRTHAFQVRLRLFETGGRTSRRIHAKDTAEAIRKAQELGTVFEVAQVTAVVRADLEIL